MRQKIPPNTSPSNDSPKTSLSRQTAFASQDPAAIYTKHPNAEKYFIFVSLATTGTTPDKRITVSHKKSPQTIPQHNQRTKMGQSQTRSAEPRLQWSSRKSFKLRTSPDQSENRHFSSNKLILVESRVANRAILTSFLNAKDRIMFSYIMYCGNSRRKGIKSATRQGRERFSMCITPTTLDCILVRISANIIASSQIMIVPVRAIFRTSTPGSTLCLYLH